MKARFSFFVRRLAAFALDAALLFAGVLVTQGILYGLGLNPVIGRVLSGGDSYGVALHAWVTATTSLPFALYYALLHSSRRQATLGKRVLRLQVTDTRGGRISFGRGLARAAVMLIPFEVNHTILFHVGYADPATTGILIPALIFFYALLGAYALTALLTPHGQSLDDLATGTRVSRVS